MISPIHPEMITPIGNPTGVIKKLHFYQWLSV